MNRDQKKRRVAKLLEENCCCANEYCECELYPAITHLDHKTPTSRGGTDDADNLQLMCSHCNQKKGNLTDDEFSSSECKEWAEALCGTGWFGRAQSVLYVHPSYYPVLRRFRERRASEYELRGVVQDYRRGRDEECPPASLDALVEFLRPDLTEEPSHGHP